MVDPRHPQSAQMAEESTVRTLAPRLPFAVDDAFALAQPDRAFDLVAGRPLLQAIQDAPRMIVDTLRVPRRVFADILRAWGDGHAEPLAAGSSLSADEFRAHFDEAIASISDPDHYAVWMVSEFGGRRPH